MEHEFRKKLGKRIKSLREFKKISREELAFRVDISGSYVGMIERAENDFKISKLFKIAKALEVNPQDLLDFED